MRLPKELKAYLKELKPTPIPLIFVETLEFKNSEFISHLRAIKYHKSFKEPLVKEVFRESESKTLINTDFNFYGMGGWRVAFETKRTSYYGTIEPQNKMINYTWKKPNVEKELLRKLEDIYSQDSSLQYMKVKAHSTLFNIIDFIKTYREQPSLEMLAKMNVEYLFTDSRVFKIKDKDKKAFITWIKENQEYIKTYRPNYLFIRGCIKTKLEPHDYATYQFNASKLKRFKKFFTIKEIMGVLDYLDKQKSCTYDYLLYLSNCEALENDLSEYGIKFPRNLKSTAKAIKILFDKNEQKRFEKEMEKIKSVYSDIINGVKTDFKIYVPNSPKEIVELGDKFHNCLRTYVDKIQKGEAIVFAFMNNEEPIECCELKINNKKLDLIQLRGEYNQSSEYHDICKSSVNNFIKSYQVGA